MFKNLFKTSKKEETYWVFVPLKDITAYELARAVAALKDARVVEKFPPEVKRHFVKRVA
jgi:hypothetical protein